MDSVEIVKLALTKTNPEEMSRNGPPTGPKLVTVAIDKDCESDFTLAWAIGYVAVQAAKDGAINVLHYAVQHPIYPVAYTMKCRFGDGYMFTDSGVEFGGGLMTLIHVASMGGHVHVIHYLLVGHSGSGADVPLKFEPHEAGDSEDPMDVDVKSDSDANGDSDANSDSGDDDDSKGNNIHRIYENPSATLADFDQVGDEPLGFLLRDFHSDPLPAASYLLSQGAKVVVPHFAVVNGNAAALRLLLEHGADVDVLVDAPTRKDRRKLSGKCTALFYAVSKNDVACVKVLLEYGADPGAKDAVGYTALTQARKKKNWDVVDVLLEASSEKPELIKEAERIAAVLHMTTNCKGNHASAKSIYRTYVISLADASLSVVLHIIHSRLKSTVPSHD
ncbi:hypothetical protein HDU96_002176 [Phlyctochytrium bullatum]|nr:hypothetical protein HDU96_002176 [Phlyctochytrium bullatum]